MITTTSSAAERIGPKEDNAFALHALLAYGVSVLLIIFLGGRLQLYNLNLGLLVTEIAFIALPASIVLLMHRKTVDGKLFSIPGAKKLSLTAVVGGCAIAIAVYKGIVTRKALVGVDTSGIDVTGGMSLLLLALLAPLCEELLFRPVIQGGLARHWSNRTAVLATAMLFALFHLSLLRFAETFVIGLFAGIVYLKTRNLWCPVVVHVLCNALGPVLWRHAPHLTFLLNPGTSIGLACLALASCYFLGERSPEPLKGLRQRIGWAVFGIPGSLQTTQRRSRQVTLLTWGIVASLMALLGYGHAAMMHQLEGHKFKSNYVVSEKDEWTVVSPNEIHARSELVIRKSPETYEDLIVQLPIQGATIQEVKLADNDLPFTRIDGGEYRIDLSSHQDAVQSGTITVRWSFLVTCLTRSERWGYMTPLKSLAASDSFSLELRLADGCGFRFMGDNMSRAQHLFGSTTDKPKMNYGSCGMTLVGREHRQSVPADADEPRR
jgi:membrane protease YdiL (CAAX protease family)